MSVKKFSALSKARGASTAHIPADQEDLITVPLVVKGDVAGSVEALVEILDTRQPQGFRLNVVHSGIGPISDGDLEMAASTNGIYVCACVRACMCACMCAFRNLQKL